MFPGAATWATGPDVSWEVAGPGSHAERLLVLSRSAEGVEACSVGT